MRDRYRQTIYGGGNQEDVYNLENQVAKWSHLFRACSKTIRPSPASDSGTPVSAIPTFKKWHQLQTRRGESACAQLVPAQEGGCSRCCCPPACCWHPPSRDRPLAPPRWWRCRDGRHRGSCRERLPPALQLQQRPKGGETPTAFYVQLQLGSCSNWHQHHSVLQSRPARHRVASECEISRPFSL